MIRQHIEELIRKAWSLGATYGPVQFKSSKDKLDEFIELELGKETGSINIQTINLDQLKEIYPNAQDVEIDLTDKTIKIDESPFRSDEEIKQLEGNHDFSYPVIESEKNRFDIRNLEVGHRINLKNQAGTYLVTAIESDTLWIISKTRGVQQVDKDNFHCIVSFNKKTDGND